MDEGEEPRIQLAYGIEMDLAHICNLHCRYCSHYSNYGLKGVVSISDGICWLGALAKRVVPKTFYLQGGEPMLNPNLCEFIWAVREFWPETKLGVVSNGLLLDRQPDLWTTLAQTGAILEISRHSHTDEVYLKRFEPAVTAARVAAQHHGVQLIVREGYSTFYATYRGEGPTMRPFNLGQPKESWTNCCNRYCMNLHQGKLWKCPPIAFLKLVTAKFGLDTLPDWQPYLSYQGLDVNASRHDYAVFLTKNAGPEAICNMCPTTLDDLHYHTDVTTMPKFPSP
jgi:uncharacterized Fe-S cluster-containing radical SAM superfamily protein